MGDIGNRSVNSPQNILFVVGATATGKSEVALQLAEQLGASILVMDAMQVYQGLEVGVSKPTMEERQRVVHGGLDLVPWTEAFDVARYVEAASGFLRTCTERVIICGGTGLYYHALTQGLCEAPRASVELREELSKLTLAELQERLHKVDPEIYHEVDIQNPRRVQRAIETMETTGRSLRTWQKETPSPVVNSFKAVWLRWPREVLRQRIADRTCQMLKRGWVEEVRGLLRESGAEKLAQCPAIGYKEFMQVCLGQLSLEKATERVVLATAQYAKRQETWFKKETGLTEISMGNSIPALCEQLRALC